jgi:hypothetical protein
MKNDPITRKQAIAWWNSLPQIIKDGKAMIYYNGREASTLTGREIETIYHSRI